MHRGRTIVNGLRTAPSLAAGALVMALTLAASGAPNPAGPSSLRGTSSSYPRTWNYPGLTAPLAGGGSGAREGGLAPELKAVEENVADTNGLSTSLRQVESGLREPAGFDQVYQVPGRDDLYLRASGGVYAVFPQSIYGKYQDKSKNVITYAQIPAGTVFYIGQRSLESLAPRENPEDAVKPHAPPGPGGPTPAAAAPGSGSASTGEASGTAQAPAAAQRAQAGAKGASQTAPKRGAPLDRAGSRVLAMDESELAVLELRRQLRLEQAEVPPSILNQDGYRAARIRELMDRAVQAEAARASAAAAGD